MHKKIWLVTGVSSGFGNCLVDAIIAQGDYVVGSLRKDEQVAEFNKKYADKASAVKLDVTKTETLESIISKIIAEHKTIDVLVNNAGYGLFGAVEEISLAQARAQMETNFFGALALTQAVLPFMRAQKSGSIVQISSVAGFCSLAGLGIYNASKYALEGFSEALSQEVAPLGIKVLIVEPGPFRTHWAGGSSQTAEKLIADYAPTAHAMYNQIKGYSGKQPGDPQKGAELIIKAVKHPNPPLRLPLGQVAIERIRAKMGGFQKEIAAWEAESVATSITTQS